MKVNFKTSLLATVISVACCSAFAGNVTVSKQIHSMEGLEGFTTTQTSNAISYTVQAAYAVGDKITFTFEKDALIKNNFPSQINVAAVNSPTPANAIAGMGLGLLNNDAQSVTYRVTSLSQPNDGAKTATDYTDKTTIGAVITLGKINYAPAAVLTTGISVTVDSKTSAGDVLDNSGTRTGKIAEAKSQFGSLSISDQLEGTIDVVTERKKFTTANDFFSWKVTNPDSKTWLNLATVNAVDGTQFILTGETGELTGIAKSHWVSGGTVAVDEKASTVTFSFKGETTLDAAVFTPPGTVALNEQDFKGKLVYNYVSAGGKVVSKVITDNADMGSWDLNGAVVEVPYLPYGPNISQILEVSNKGSLAGDIWVEAFDDQGKSYVLGSVGQATANSVTSIAQAVSAALVTKGFVGETVALEITVNAPETAITVYATYNVGGSDRGYVNTSQYKGVK